MATAAPSELDMFRAMCSQYNGRETLDRLWQLEFCQLGLDLDQTESWFRRHPNKFRLHEATNGELVVSVMVPRARLCFGHTSKMGCKRGDQCRFFHLCRYFLQGSCQRDSRCNFIHDLSSEQARKLIRELQLDTLQDDEIYNVIRLSTPKVCDAYNTHSCLKADRCPDIHVCSGFVRGRCGNKACGLDHDCYFDTKQTRRILSDFRMAKTDRRTVLKTLLIPQTAAAPRQNLRKVNQATSTKTSLARTTSRPTPPANASLPAQAVGPKAKAPDLNEERILDSDTTICEGFLSGKCLKSRLCLQHHIKAPYLWQYQDLQSQGKQWVSFSPDVTAKLEEVFSQPSNVSIALNDIEPSLNGWTAHFDRMELEISDSHQRTHTVRIRRLSTPSSVESANGAWSTKWVWYWEDGNSWCEYRSNKYGSSAHITSDDIERAYLTKRPWYNFQTDEYSYILDFTEMYQQNLDQRYSTKRLVRRRPVFVQFQIPRATNTSQSSSGTKGSLPTTWKRMPPKEAFIRVSLAPTHSEFKEVETLFRQTMKENMIIIQIERVQNPRLWEKYDINKQQMTRKSIDNQRGRGAVTRSHNYNDERKLFHGTEPDIIKGICHQNFDHRLSGKNATKYGKGSYFAKKASYSHRYSDASPDGTRYMFLANVLVGMYTAGKKDIPRPPPIDPNDPNGDLYDSCVDDEANPKIFVVFKDDQCYPAYLITYQDDLVSSDILWYSRGIQTYFYLYF
ncbi:PARP12 [Branchiostoma lanceolatum]|uniref:PARP12 protein n=1 Tax=Branchiostoma lanceolatum TaxID=7740 RepID=A0A8J9VD73_BRALA|nr:PARP12 [Branchiostoma lanceolatum]